MCVSVCDMQSYKRGEERKGAGDQHGHGHGHGQGHGGLGAVYRKRQAD